MSDWEGIAVQKIQAALTEVTAKKKSLHLRMKSIRRNGYNKSDVIFAMREMRRLQAKMDVAAKWLDTATMLAEGW